MKGRWTTVSPLAQLILFAAINPLMQNIAPGQEPADAPPAGQANWSQDLAAWRTQRDAQIAGPDGWLTLIGMEWLKPGVNSIGAAADNTIKLRSKAPDHIGLLTVIGKPQGPRTVQLLAPAGGFPADLKIDGNPAREGALTVEGARPSTISLHGLTMSILSRGGRYVLRIKDADSPARSTFKGLNWYAPDTKFRVSALWTPYKPARIEKIPTGIGTTLDLPAPGVAEFMLGHRTMRLEPVIEPGAEGTLFFILRDETGKSATDETARYLHTGLPNHGLGENGLLTLDFNRLENPACAYTPYANCPQPPPQNRLPIALEAGEKRYSH
jgi:uncharacterized protein (DUF1684 family)